jgi:hypothetical protein
LKSTLMKTVLSFKSRSLIDNFDIRSLYVTPHSTRVEGGRAANLGGATRGRKIQ